MLRVIFDTNIYGMLILEDKLDSVRKKISKDSNFVIYGFKPVRKELRETPKKEKLGRLSKRNLLLNLYDELTKKTVVLINKYSPETRIQPNDKKEKVIKKVERILKHPVVGAIPCYCDVLQNKRTSLLAVEKPKHPFIKDLEEVTEKLALDN